MLKNDAIAGDGTKAAALSYDLFADKRKIQIWNPDEKRKTGEIYCPSEIEKIPVKCQACLTAVLTIDAARIRPCSITGNGSALAFQNSSILPAFSDTFTIQHADR